MNRSQVSLARLSEPRVKSGTMNSSAPAFRYSPMMAATSAGVPTTEARPPAPSRLSFSQPSSVDRNSSAWVDTWMLAGSRPT